MDEPGHIEMHANCGDRCLRSEDFFCHMSPATEAAFACIKTTHLYSRGSMLFLEGQQPDRVYVLCSGRVKLSANSRDGKAMIFRVAGPGDVLGISSCMSGKEHEATAEVIENCRVDFVRSVDFLAFLRTNNEAAFKALQQLTRDYHKVYARVRSLGLSVTATEKLTKLLLDWCDAEPSGNGKARIPLAYTHEEIAEMIGTSRETVTRIFASLRKRGLVLHEGAALLIPDRGRLEKSIASGRRGPEVSPRSKSRAATRDG